MKYEDFIKALQADDDLNCKFRTKLEQANPADAESAWQIASDAARELGFDIDTSEFALAQRSAQPLSDEELQQVSGGGRESCVADYVCNYALNTCIRDSSCYDHEMCYWNIACQENNKLWTDYKDTCHRFYTRSDGTVVVAY